MNRLRYLTFVVLEIIALFGFVAALLVPPDTFSEFFKWKKDPSPQTYKELVEKQRQEHAAHLLVAAPFAVAAVLLARPLARYRQRR